MEPGLVAAPITDATFGSEGRVEPGGRRHGVARTGSQTPS